MPITSAFLFKETFCFFHSTTTSYAKRHLAKVFYSSFFKLLGDRVPFSTVYQWPWSLPPLSVFNLPTSPHSLVSNVFQRMFKIVKPSLYIQSYHTVFLYRTSVTITQNKAFYAIEKSHPEHLGEEGGSFFYYLFFLPVGHDLTIVEENKSPVRALLRNRR